MEENKKPDDGSLAFLNIPRDESNRSFNCDETTQSKLVNTSFWVCDFIEDVPTRFSKTKGTKGQTLVKIKPDRTALRLTLRSSSRVQPTFSTFVRKSRSATPFPAVSR